MLGISPKKKFRAYKALNSLKTTEATYAYLAQIEKVNLLALNGVDTKVAQMVQQNQPTQLAQNLGNPSINKEIIDAMANLITPVKTSYSELPKDIKNIMDLIPEKSPENSNLARNQNPRSMG